MQPHFQVAAEDTLQQLSLHAIAGARDPRLLVWVYDEIIRAKTYGQDIPALLLKRVQSMPGYDVVVTPEYLAADPVHVLIDGAGGDASDRSCALAAALVAYGFECRIVAHGYYGKHYSNALVQVRIGEDWFYAETTRDVPFGQLAKEPTSVQFGPTICLCGLDAHAS